MDNIHTSQFMGDGEHSFTFANGLQLSYRVQGSGPRKIVFLHGFGAARTTWDDLAPFFPTERYTLYMLDLKGFGDSSKPRDNRYSVEEQADLVTSFLKGMCLEQVILTGHSLGGAISLLVAINAMKAKEVGLVSRLVIIDGAAYPQPLPRFMKKLSRPLLGWCILHLLPVRFLVTFTLDSVYFRSETITEERIHRYVRFYDRPGIGYVMQQTVRELVPERYGSFASFYPSLNIPALLIWGEYDRVIRRQIGERLKNDLPDSRLLVIPECGHNPHEEEPAATYAAIDDFLAQTVHTTPPVVG
jgi:pimeloyl-ACP methyl ester carboxylesterase